MLGENTLIERSQIAGAECVRDKDGVKNVTTRCQRQFGLFRAGVDWIRELGLCQLSDR